MNETRGKARITLSFLLLSGSLLLSACARDQSPASPTAAPTSTATAQVDLPAIVSVEADRNEVPRYESIELTLRLRQSFRIHMI